MEAFSISRELLFIRGIVAISACVYLTQENVKSNGLQCGGCTRYGAVGTTSAPHPGSFSSVTNVFAGVSGVDKSVVQAGPGLLRKGKQIILVGSVPKKKKKFPFGMEPCLKITVHGGNLHAVTTAQAFPILLHYSTRISRAHPRTFLH